jgi:hypothetical protein
MARFGSPTDTDKGGNKQMYIEKILQIVLIMQDEAHGNFVVVLYCCFNWNLVKAYELCPRY